MNLPLPERKEGTTDNPIIIHGVTDKAFEGFIKWCRHIPWATARVSLVMMGLFTKTQLYDLLHLGDLWDSRSLMKFAIQRLEHLPLSPCRKLESRFASESEYGSIKWHEKRYKQRELFLHLSPLLYLTPNGPSAQPYDHKNCIRITREIWFTHIGPALLQDLNLFDNSSVDFYMRSMQSAFKGVNVECFLEMCDSIRNERKLTNMATFVLEKLTAAIAAEIGPNPALEERFFTDSE
ncbi:hypothetical protein BKA70DRAFT_1230740 [Coprinopsis sp. MPI-PUGE-AT-0042]|nr:hypothetical protein BKA70DRAFT_1230740 [Coprinopsis sp. MPI-PUGE-AT-0042]